VDKLSEFIGANLAEFAPPGGPLAVALKLVAAAALVAGGALLAARTRVELLAGEVKDLERKVADTVGLGDELNAAEHEHARLTDAAGSLARAVEEQGGLAALRAQPALRARADVASLLARIESTEAALADTRRKMGATAASPHSFAL
jgi:BMFP domain-containing protein YqiC